MTTYEEIKRYIQIGLEQRSKYLIVCCDTFNYESYPTFTDSKSEMHVEVSRITKADMQVVDEVYLLEEPLCWSDLETEGRVRRDKP